MFIISIKKIQTNLLTVLLLTFLTNTLSAQVPSITSFTPLSAKPGDAVTITGNNFNTTAANNVVFFGATKATVTTATATSLTVTVPVGATYAPITLLNTSTFLACASPSNFTPIFSPQRPSITTSSFSTRVDFSMSGSATFSYHAAIGDIDGDGKIDLIVANSATNNVSVFRNTANVGSITTTSFAPKIDFAAGVGAYFVSIGDIDGDGKLDLVIPNNGGNSVSILRNTSTSGNINFATKVDINLPASTNPVQSTITDIDGDGKMDVITANQSTAGISVFRNTSSVGNISFAAKVDFATGNNPNFVAAGDIDGDGKFDLCVVNYNSSSVSVLRNTATVGTISFAAKVDIAAGPAVKSAFVGDLDGDGNPDIVVANLLANNIAIIRNTSTTGSISFAAKVDIALAAISNPYYVNAGDIDGDGKLDIVTANFSTNTASVLKNNSTIGTFSFATRVDFSTGTNPTSASIGDLDADGRPDLLFSNNGSGFVSVLRNANFPGITTSGSLTAFSTCTGTASSTQSFTIGGTALTSNIIVTPPNGYELSLSSSTGFASSVTLTPVSSTVAPTTIYIRLSATATGSPSGNITCSSTGAVTQNIAVTGTVNALPTITLGTITSVNTSATSFSIPYTGITGSPNQYNITTGTPTAMSSFVAVNNAALTSSPINVTIPASAANTYNFNLTVRNSTTGCVSNTIPFTLLVTQPVVLTCPTNTTIIAGQPQASVNTQFATWLNTASGSGGCSGILTNNNTGAPSTAGGSAVVTFTYSSSCAPTTTTCQATFTVSPPPPVVLTCPTNTTISTGQSQASVNTQFATWLNTASASGGCSGILTNNNTGAPSAAGGSTTVTFTYSSSCAPTTTTCQATFAVASLTPTITSFTPLSAKPGDAVTITGTNFNTTAANNVVFFGATKATVTAASATSLTVTVPVGATYAPITLLNTTTVLACASLNNFNPIYSPAKTSITTSDFSAKVDFTTATNPVSVALGDLDGDGKPDLALANYSSNSISILRNISTSGSIITSSFATKVDFTVGVNPISIAVGDLDGDGKLDLVVANYQGSSVSVLRNTTTTGTITSSSFATKVDFTTGSGPNQVAIGDIDGDGKSDLAIANSFNSTISILRNTATAGNITSSSFATKVDFTSGSQPIAVAISDLNGDGKLDVVVANRVSNSVSVLRNTATSGSINSSSFATRVDFATDTEPYALALGDLDGDGKIDLVTANAAFTANSISVLRNTTTTGVINSSSFAAKVDFATTATQRSVAIGDLNGDGKPDIATNSYTNNNITVLRNTSISGSITSSSFANKVDFTTGANPYTVAIGDLDGDGKPELISTNYVGQSVSVLRNADVSLPITLSQFSVTKQDNNALLKWTSQSEINAAAFEIERSLDGVSFYKVSIVSAKGFGSSYSFLDATLPASANIIYYRLKLLDKDSKYTYSSIRVLNFKQLSNGVITVYPNPIKGNNFGLQIQDATKGEYIIALINSLGQVVHTQQVTLNGTTTSVTIMPNQKLGTGLYSLQLINTKNSKERYSQSVLITE